MSLSLSVIVAQQHPSQASVIKVGTNQVAELFITIINNKMRH
jgi:hypothetical protein